MLSSLPLLCYMAQGKWKGFLAGSGYYGFGLLDFSLDWNYISFFSPLYIPLWSNASQIGGALIACWIIYPIMYFCNVLGAQTYPPMSSDTFDTTGNSYDVSAVLTPQYTLNQTAMDAYSQPRWSTSYAMNFFFGFACSTGALLYSVLFYGKDSVNAVINAWKNRRSDYGDPYLKLMSRTERVPHWWYMVILVLCMGLSIGCLYGADLGLPVSFPYTFSQINSFTDDNSGGASSSFASYRWSALSPTASCTASPVCRSACRTWRRFCPVPCLVETPVLCWRASSTPASFWCKTST